MTLLFTLLVLPCHSRLFADALVVVANGKSDYVIALSGQSRDLAKLNEAAALLQSSIRKATGVALPIFKESDAPADAAAIYIGKTVAAKRAGLPIQKVTGWGYLNRVVDRNIYLIGDEERARPLKPRQQGYSGFSGTYKAVTTFLEQQVGVRFVLPGEVGIHVPELKRLAIDATMDVSWSPRFTFIGRRVSPYSGKHEYDPYAIANNFFGRYASDSRVFWTGGSHTWSEFVPREKYIETRPDYFGLFEGKRDPLRRNILCLSQSEVHDLLVKGVVKKFDEGYQMVMLGQADGYVECQCDKCQAIHPDVGEKLWIKHRQIAERIRALRPEKQVVLSSYVTTTKPPLSFDSFPENVVIMNNRYSPAYFKAWKAFPTPRVVYIPDWLRSWPRVPPRYAVNLVRLWKENNVIAVYMGGGLDQPGCSWGLNGPSYYTFGKAMEDPSRGADELEREFIEASFGAAAEPMGAFFRAMHRRMEARQLLDRHETGNPDRRYRGFPFEMYPDDYLCHFFPPQILNEMDRQLARAQERAQSDETRARIELVAAEFRYLQSVATVHHMFRAYQVAPSWTLFDALQKQVRGHAKIYDWLHPNGKALNPGGYRKLRTPFNIGWPCNDALKKVTGPPFDWDFEKIRQSGDLPVPVIKPRIRGGQSLKPYESKGAPGNSKTDGNNPNDPETGAPFDQ